MCMHVPKHYTTWGLWLSQWLQHSMIALIESTESVTQQHDLFWHRLHVETLVMGVEGGGWGVVSDTFNRYSSNPLRALLVHTNGWEAFIPLGR